jgi:Xaa-Pro aminopeptidase
MQPGSDTVNGIRGEEFADRRGACAERVRAAGLDALVVTAPSDLTYLIGYPGTSTLGPNPFCAGVAAALVVTAAGDATLCAGEPDLEVAGTPLDRVGPLEIERFETFAGLQPLAPRSRLGESLGHVLGRASAVGYQPASLPANVFSLLSEPGIAPDWRDAGELVMALRMRKSPAEFELIRAAIAVCDAAQASVSRLARDGQRQGDLFDAVRAVVTDEAGGPVPCILEVSLGPGTEVPGDGDREISAGDLVLTDIAPRVGAYWGDSCNTQTLEPPSAAQQDMLTTVREVLERATEAIRPGLAISELDDLMRAGIGRNYPAYTGGGGHGIGLDFQESPRLVPSEEGRLESGMVMAMEPAIYLPDASVRLEHVVAVTEDGCEVLSRHLDGAGPAG